MRKPEGNRHATQRDRGHIGQIEGKTLRCFFLRRRGRFQFTRCRKQETVLLRSINRVGRNPKTLEEFEVSARRVITFNPSSVWRKQISNNSAPEIGGRVQPRSVFSIPLIPTHNNPFKPFAFSRVRGFNPPPNFVIHPATQTCLIPGHTV
ncbi:MAG: HU family DNA-binding protein [SAR324 cluster bacterium]|nr:HU family DNA-binding protein [SAR324 cluster bacterium]